MPDLQHYGEQDSKNGTGDLQGTRFDRAPSARNGHTTISAAFAASLTTDNLFGRRPRHDIAMPFPIALSFRGILSRIHVA
ncbi:hypothetical protein AB0K02_17225 [Streptomyces sp. NPDC049597]|uniref:hypothetical protein n=1 Tax=Streptomyces sp. NPDC049597 TaxID=3155276 RepID=UPI00341A38E4